MSEVEIAAIAGLGWLVIVLVIVIVGRWMDWRAHDRYKSIREFDCEAEE